MNIKRVILATIAVAVFNIIVGALTCGGVFSWVYKLEPTTVWKPMTSIFPLIMIANAFFVNLIFVLVYAIINKGVPGNNTCQKGVMYGLLVWLVGLLPGILATYIFMTVATTVVVYWTIWGLIVTPLKGWIAAAIYGE